MLAAASALADTLTLSDGTFLRGRVERVCDGVVEFRAASASDSLLSVPLANVESLRVDDTVMLSQGDVVLRGIASISGGRAHSSAGIQSFALDERLSLWRPSAPSAGISPLHGWRYEFDLDLSGRSGAASGSGLSAGVRADYLDDGTKLDLGAGLSRIRSGGKDTADDLHLTGSRERTLSEDVFWYARADLGYDHARALDFLSVAAAGYGLKLQSDARGSLSVRAGLGQRHEESSSLTGPDVNSLAGDLGLNLERDLGWGRLKVALSLVPTLDSLSDVYARNESSLEFLGRDGPLALRLGLIQDYRSERPNGLGHLDNTYFVRVVYKWK